MRIALVADLHNRPCEAIIDAIKRAKPDIIAVAGDLMELIEPNAPDASGGISNRSPERRRNFFGRFLYTADACIPKRLTIAGECANANAYRFLRESSAIAPTFYALGNHERYVSADEITKIAKTGAVMLHNADSALSVRGINVRVGALSTARDADWLERYRKSEADVRLLLCHHPEYYERCALKTRADIILSGHAHGGQWRLFGQPVFAPGQGLFPKYAGGLYDNALIVSRGLANTARAPRLWNKRELVIVETI